MQDDDEKLKRLMAQRDKLNARITAEKAKTKKKARKDDTRKKVLYGAALLSAEKAGDVKATQIHALLGKHIKRASDRAFLGLALLPGQDETE